MPEIKQICIVCGETMTIYPGANNHRCSKRALASALAAETLRERYANRDLEAQPFLSTRLSIGFQMLEGIWNDTD